MSIQIYSELYFHVIVLAQLYWNKSGDRRGRGNIAAFTYTMYDKCRSVCSYVNVRGKDRENDCNFYQYLGKTLLNLFSLGQWEALSI